MANQSPVRVPAWNACSFDTAITGSLTGRLDSIRDAEATFIPFSEMRKDSYERRSPPMVSKQRAAISSAGGTSERGLSRVVQERNGHAECHGCARLRV